MMATVFQIDDARRAEQGGYVSQIARIERELFFDAWDSLSVCSMLSQFGVGLLIALNDEDEVVGYLIYQIIFEVAEVLRIATDIGFQKQGMGKMLLDEFDVLCKDKGAERILLEVKADNTSAIRLYTRQGFHQIDVRVGYYKDEWGVVDALIMQKELSSAEYQ
ncbi:ribosomal protein S18-alanine N-acetyltransferase [Moraxella sp. E6BC]|uniref:ribosomal protein S18-alanine N-acetyltransferase n=2 Tax=unclassified Moraxella TaxID=2685852 RepID=UPI00359D8F61